MRYRLTCLTPVLIGDGFRLSPIDYMVWKDQVNVLDQRRIFRLLAKGPRLDSYLSQIKKADKLDFASWGGFAQNFAGRRIPFEHPSCSSAWERARVESLHIPTFISGIGGHYLPGTAVKGALRTPLLFSRWNDNILRDLAVRLDGDRPPRRPGEAAEEQLLGAPGLSRLKGILPADSEPVAASAMQIYLLRTSTLVPRGGGRYELGWKQSPRGAVDGRRPEDSTPFFAEMAQPGTVFEGSWSENPFYAQPEIQRSLRWREPLSRSTLLETANRYAERLLDLHRRYAESAGLAGLSASLDRLTSQLAAARASGDRCLLCIGWGGGFLGKTACPDPGAENYRQMMRRFPLYERAIQSGLPFPKTRRIVFLQNQPASLPGWSLLEVG